MRIPQAAAREAGLRRQAADPDRAKGKAWLRRREFERKRGLDPAQAAAPSRLGSLEQLATTEAHSAPAAALAPAQGYATSLARARATSDQDALPETTTKGNVGPAGLELTSVAPPPPRMAWRELGPRGIPHGQTYGRGVGSRIACAGRVAALVVDPSAPDHVLVGSAAGGIWESRDAGATWLPRTDHLPTLTTGAIVFDRTDPLIVYAGTGEGNWYQIMGQGVLRSCDGGTTWHVLATDPFVGEGFYDLAIDGRDPAVLYAATTRGCYVSRDHGLSWHWVLSGQAWAISVAPPGPAADQEVLVATVNGLYASTDHGATWNPEWLSGSTRAWTRLAVRHVPSDPGRVFAFGLPVGDNAAPELRERRPDGGWEQAPVPLPGDLATHQAWYDWCLEIDPSGSDKVYVGAIDLHRGTRCPLGAWHWENLSSRSGSQDGDSIHPDQHCLVLATDVPGRIFAGNDGGVYRSDDDGAHWLACVDGLAITEVEYIALNVNDPDWILAGTQDNGTLRAGASGWEHVADGDGGDCGASSGDPNRVYHTQYGIGIERSFVGGDFDSWSPVLYGGPGGLFYPPLECGSSLVVQAGAEVWLSSNGGDSWAMVSLPTEPDDRWLASALTAPSEDRVFIGTEGGAVFEVVRTPGGFWELTAHGVAVGGFIADLAHDPSDPQRLWLVSTFGSSPGRVMTSRNGGLRWDLCSGDLPKVPVRSIAVDPLDATRIWVGTDAGVYETLDDGVHWARLGVGLPNVIVGDLVLHAATRRLRAGTRSRGVWEIQV